MSEITLNEETSVNDLGSPYSLPCGVIVPNRIIKAAMTEQMATADNRPTPELVRLYERWGRGGAGALITGNVMVDRRALEGPRNVVVEDERDMPILREWAERAQAGGSQLWMQISHPGRQTPRGVSSMIVAPSAVPLKGFGPMFAKPRAVTEAEILDIIKRFGRTAALAREAGFSGVQVHGAHGYLVSEFLSPLVNQRDDDWGGTPEKRMRFLLEIVRKVRAAVGAEFPISVKLNSADFQRGGFSENDSMAVVRALEMEGVDLLEISGGNYENPMMVASGEANKKQRASTQAREAFFLDYAKKVRAVTRLPLMLTGGLRTVPVMARILEGGSVDFIGLARPLALDPDFPRKVIQGEVERSPVARVNIGVKVFDDMLQSLWHQEQLHLLGRGQDTNIGYSRYRALAKGLWNIFG